MASGTDDVLKGRQLYYVEKKDGKYLYWRGVCVTEFSVVWDDAEEQKRSERYVLMYDDYSFATCYPANCVQYNFPSSSPRMLLSPKVLGTACAMIVAQAEFKDPDVLHCTSSTVKEYVRDEVVGQTLALHGDKRKIYVNEEEVNEDKLLDIIQADTYAAIEAVDAKLSPPGEKPKPGIYREATESGESPSTDEDVDSDEERLVYDFNEEVDAGKRRAMKLAHINQVDFVESPEDTGGGKRAKADASVTPKNTKAVASDQPVASDKSKSTATWGIIKSAAPTKKAAPAAKGTKPPAEAAAKLPEVLAPALLICGYGFRLLRLGFQVKRFDAQCLGIRGEGLGATAAQRALLVALGSLLSALLEHTD